MKNEKALITEEEKREILSKSKSNVKLEIEDIPVSEQVEIIELYANLVLFEDYKDAVANIIVGSYGINPKKDFNGNYEAEGYNLPLLNEIVECLEKQIVNKPNNKNLPIVFEVVNGILEANKVPKKHNEIDSDNKLTVSQIALIYVYNKVVITRSEAVEIAKTNKHESGNNLYNTYVKFSSRANRVGKPYPFTPKKVQNKIQLLESVLSLVKTDKQTQVTDEINTLKSYDTSE